jgi:polyisoprenoid-binding protein YceI
MNAMSRPSLAVSAVLAVGLAAPAFASDWQIDAAHSDVGFSVRHLMVSNVKGHFTGVSGAVALDEKDLSRSRVEATIDVATVATGDAKRDEHLQSADFFDAAKYPKMTFKSKAVRKTANGWQIVGDFTLHGVTREVVLDAGSGLSPEVKDPWGGVRSGLTASAVLDRKDYGLTWNKALDNGGLAVGDEVKVTLEIELLKKVETAQK